MTMHPAIVIRGIGMVSALGCGVAAFREGLQGLRRPNLEGLDGTGSSGAAALPGAQSAASAPSSPSSPAPLPVLCPPAGCEENLERFLARRALRRLDVFARRALLAAFLAVEDAGLDFADRARVGLVIGTGYGPLGMTFQFQDSLIADGDRGASPTAFASSVANALAAQISLALRLEGPCQTVTCFEETTAGALAVAVGWLRGGAVDAVIVGLGDEVHPALGYAFDRMRRAIYEDDAAVVDATAGTAAAEELTAGNLSGGIEPFDFVRCTALPGEGFVAFVLTAALEGREPTTAYGRLEEIRWGSRSRSTEVMDAVGSMYHAVLLAASGRRADAAGYARLPLAGNHLAAYSPLYGSLPTGLAFEVAAAALARRDAILYSAPARGGAPAGWPVVAAAAPLPPGARLACVQCAGPRRWTLVSLA